MDNGLRVVLRTKAAFYSFVSNALLSKISPSVAHERGIDGVRAKELSFGNLGAVIPRRESKSLHRS